MNAKHHREDKQEAGGAAEAGWVGSLNAVSGGYLYLPALWLPSSKLPFFVFEMYTFLMSRIETRLSRTSSGGVQSTGHWRSGSMLEMRGTYFVRALQMESKRHICTLK